MTDPWFLAAGALALVGLGVHVFVGGKDVARPLLAADLTPVAKYMNYACWHGVSIMLLAMSGSFFVAAKKPAAIDVAIQMTVLSGVFGLWVFILALWKRQPLFAMRQWIFFLLIAAIGLAGLHYQSMITVD
ncbi:MAG: hypothetical protein GC153_02920 [Alphaproteobacteria bacterium]|nr:hypothetical protein [Alphaproteobacteria bacterium]